MIEYEIVSKGIYLVVCLVPPTPSGPKTLRSVVHGVGTGGVANTPYWGAILRYSFLLWLALAP